MRWGCTCIQMLLKNQLKVYSRKQRMTYIGLACLGATYTAGLITLSYRPDIASQIVTLSQVVVVAVGTMVTAYIGAQGYVDAKTATPPTVPT